MNEENQSQKKLLGLFNVIFFIIILAVVVFSIVVIMKDSSISGESADTATEDTIKPSIIDDQLIPRQVETPIENYNSANFPPPDDQLHFFYPNEYLGYLSNPGIGWINRWGEEDLSSIPTTLEYSDRSEIRWDILNPWEGEFNWGPLDAQLNEAVAHGKQYSFRVYTMVGESFGGHAVPNWVLDKGARILPSGEPDYSNCVYQAEWGRFVEELIHRYDGNPNIAFIDISGYGNFNEWSWRDDQTIWDENWADQYAEGIAGPTSNTNIDSQARRRLADMFVGGSYSGHICHDQEFNSQSVEYNYPGFQKTQLVMPYAGIVQSSQYVFLKRKDVGFRHDCLGRPSSEKIILNFGEELNQIWKTAPIVFETCNENEFVLSSAKYLISAAHASIIHNVNLKKIGQQEITNFANKIGYRYFLSEIEHSKSAEIGGGFYVSMNWLNVGNAPNYPKMGQRFELHLYLMNDRNGKLIDYLLKDNLTDWLPSQSDDSNYRSAYHVGEMIILPQGIEPGNYQIMVSIINASTGIPIQLAIEGKTSNSLYSLSSLEIKNP